MHKHLQHQLSLLGQWHAEPMDELAATRVRQQAETLLYRKPRHTGCRLTLLQLMRARYWLADFEEFDFQLMLHQIQGSKRLRALFNLAYGQLLMASKREPSMEYLQRGLRLGDGIMRVEEYFMLFNRHQLLRHIPLTSRGQARHSFAELMNEAAVIAKLTNKDLSDAGYNFSAKDTLV